MGFPRLWNRRGADPRKISRQLYRNLATAALNPALYQSGAARDNFDGRAMMFTAHASLLIRRLRAVKGSIGRKVAVRLNHAVLDGFDAAYRELGVGDSSIARKVRKLAERHYGFGKALNEALGISESQPLLPLIECLERNAVTEKDRESLLAAYLLHNATLLDGLTDASFLKGDFAWRIPDED